ncbi:Haloacid dehalogenase superfamily, subfamily IA, variant 2 with 3rd motif like haloacid dehalogenase/haloacid dehalogenase superfamily, subfamily IA, variant 3 with third motif having DD or ED/haloacid dehalogenase superfamily, subfamily IA, variant 1 with third motif having Dx(3-4)D or Dx(3-4)E [Streptoalloteichus tenebrarius]|uniref:Hydrolase n=1 Tax=Streptoalloteichus tenebrarius (strain ATCC 17920 / DSM 40477 / JCM 4838 / CBS 697.72 / NBRC 16177 / NCIMB 11028 / NRRL B-12390 / A12253. 1 / ISP 5477) TaxID=1933 RepID=A0ABT1I426_STRSD|nr:HAD family hydrolase [Streptoalloteichus tenebrarius]MCP2262481.1 Haloacid dehalogenase superfamily, subfamily IA, variant 2 with 3rd motif like haloacid dehalogenase/haloacid dehalogenase superfamily, subfamily IA, variant 3 with third motif having DD or ED/haloacid dehalogenase superfamily, subfamily IA, variant 1 with third motif having Dx(3-4)D or Dx(3-4)E [Streptoalloteichus tenebrarius]BFF01550.1 HAD family hydrolase [Streptoalloteichus tenebrarius]
MTIRGVLFDFSGTLYRLENDGPWLADLVDEPEDLGGEREAELVRRLTAPTGPLDGLPDHLQEAWARRDLDPRVHREVHIAVFQRMGLAEATSARFYERLCDPALWRPYPDTAEALRHLRETGVRVAVVSNIAWDIRAVLRRHGVLDLVDEVVMSYVEGRIKPDPELFRLACDRLGVDPAESLMVGDSEEADGGAAEVGCRVSIVDPLPTAERPSALLDVLAAHGLR